MSRARLNVIRFQVSFTEAASAGPEAGGTKQRAECNSTNTEYVRCQCRDCSLLSLSRLDFKALCLSGHRENAAIAKHFDCLSVFRSHDGDYSQHWRYLLRATSERLLHEPRPLPPFRRPFYLYVQAFRKALTGVQQALQQYEMSIKASKPDSERTILEQFLSASASTSILELKSQMILNQLDKIAPSGYHMLYQQTRVFANALLQLSSSPIDLSALLKEFNSASNQLSIEYTKITICSEFNNESENVTEAEYVCYSKFLVSITFTRTTASLAAALSDCVSVAQTH